MGLFTNSVTLLYLVEVWCTPIPGLDALVGPGDDYH